MIPKKGEHHLRLDKVQREEDLSTFLPFHGIHFNKDVDMEVKRECQRRYEENHTREEFMELIGRNYL